MAHLVVLLSTQQHKFVQETILSNNQGIQGMWLPKYQYCRHRDRALKRNKALMDERVPWEIFGQNVTRSHTVCAKRDRRAFYRLILFTQQSKRHIARVISHRTLTHVNKARRPGKRNDNRCDDDLLSLTKLSRRYLFLKVVALYVEHFWKKKSTWHLTVMKLAELVTTAKNRAIFCLFNERKWKKNFCT